MSNMKERSDADYEILKDNNFKTMFLDQNGEGKPGYISYGQVIIRAVWSGLHGKNRIRQLDKARLLEILKELENSFESTHSEFDTEIMSILYCFNCDNEFTGILLKDKTHGCYPLYINKAAREEGLKKHLTHIIDNWPQILELLIQYNEKWNSELEERLNPYYFSNPQ